MEEQKKEDGDRMVVLAQFTSLPEAQIVQGELESSGLKTYLEQDQWLGVARRSDMQLYSGRLFILQKDLELAEEILGDTLPKEETQRRDEWQVRQDDPNLYRILTWGFLVIFMLAFLFMLVSKLF